MVTTTLDFLPKEVKSKKPQNEKVPILLLFNFFLEARTDISKETGLFLEDLKTPKGQSFRN